MSATMKKLIFLCLYFCCAIADRQVSTKIQHNCIVNTTVCGSYAHVTATGPDGVLHYVVSAIGLPTVFVAYTAADVKLNVDWARLLSSNSTVRAKSVTLEPAKDVKYTYSLMFTKLIDYNDTNDKADMSAYDKSSTDWNIYNLDSFTWANMSQVSDVSTNTVVLKTIDDKHSDLLKLNGSFSIELTAHSNSGRESKLPHLEFSENITQFDLNMDHLWTNFSMSRFGLEIVMVGDDGTTTVVNMSKSIDDEYCPGVFIIQNWWMTTDTDTGFLQWKPVCYQSLTRSRSKATGMKYYDTLPLVDADKDLVTHSMAFGYYGDTIVSKSHATNFSFGLSQDGGYKKTQILTWSASVGYGDPPTDAVSTIVIIIILAGLGLPVVLILFGGTFMCIKKRKSKPDKALKNIQNTSNGYQPISDN